MTSSMTLERPADKRRREQTRKRVRQSRRRQHRARHVSLGFLLCPTARKAMLDPDQHPPGWSRRQRRTIVNFNVGPNKLRFVATIVRSTMPSPPSPECSSAQPSACKNAARWSGGIVLAAFITASSSWSVILSKLRNGTFQIARQALLATEKGCEAAHRFDMPSPPLPPCKLCYNSCMR